MHDWNAIKKLERMAPSQMGIADVQRIIARNTGAGLAVGFTEFEIGSIDMDVIEPEVFIVLEGSLAITTAGTEMTLAPNEALWMPAGSSLQVSVSKPSRVIYIICEMS